MDRIWEGAAILHPTKEEAEKGGRSTMLVEPFFFLAKGDSEATMIVARKITNDTNLDRVEIAVRPF